MELSFIDELKRKIVGKNRSIVFPEGKDHRIVTAVQMLHDEGIVVPIVLGKPEEIQAACEKANVSLEGVKQIDVESAEDFDDMVKEFVKIRKGKTSEEEARQIMKDPNYYGTMMVQLAKADGMVSGAINSTAATVRPALQIIKTKPGVSKTSGLMVLIGRGGRRYIMADIAINIELNAQELAEVAVDTGVTAKSFGVIPKVAMLSFSTNGSASHPLQEKMAEATRIAKEMVKERGLDIEIDGEMQFDAAVSRRTAELKFPDSPVAGQAKVYVFPSLEAGNIGYKIAQFFGGCEAIGPILQGLNKPINDLSRGCDYNEVYQLGIITASQVEE